MTTDEIVAKCLELCVKAAKDKADKQRQHQLAMCFAVASKPSQGNN